MHFRHRGEASRSQSPVKCLDFEAKRIAETETTHLLTWLGKFAQRMGDTARFILPEPPTAPEQYPRCTQDPNAPSDLPRPCPPCPTRSLDTPIPLLLR